ncbi:MAG: globin [Dehalococcoidia bacterium]|nr:globin [Dehalococcoidia bacterium]MCB9485702.1 globin [Thermoflexaceae bacterium]
MSTTLFDAAGGTEGVSQIVEAFYRRIEADQFMRSIYPEDLEPGKAKLKLFFEQWLGGGPVYSQKFGHPRLRARHFPFVIGDRHAGLWLRYMREAWHECGVPAQVETVAFERLGPLARHMVNEGQDVPREPIGDAFMQ